MQYSFYSPLLVSLLALALPAAAQDQPSVANNNQDEEVNINRAVAEGVEEFKILRSGNKGEINRYVTKVYTLQHANPYEILPYLRTIATLEKGNVITAWNPQANGPARSWIQVNVPDFQIPSIDAAVRAYDVPDFASIPGDVKFSYRTKYRSAVEVANFIRTSTLSPDGLIVGDATTNTLYVQDSPSDFKRVLAQIEFYDIPVAQLDVEVSVIELTEIDQTSLGLDWDAWKTALSGGATKAYVNSRAEQPSGDVLEASSTRWEGLLSVDATTAARFLNYLVDKGKAKILVESNLTVTNGTVATLGSGTDVPAFTYVFNKDLGKSVLTRTAAPAAVASEGLSLALVPDIAMTAARLEVALAMRSAVGVNKTGEPIFSDQDMQAELTLTEGQLYKLGGIRRTSSATQRKGLPGLRDVPVLKYLFSNETTIARETELFVFIKPTWTAPLVPAADGIKVDSPMVAPMVADILRANPNISLSPEDAALLDRYFQSRQAVGAP